MREILFRGKEKSTGLWAFGYYAKHADHKGNVTHRIYQCSAETDCGDFYPDYYEVDPETVCQYTGMTDKNGNGTEIFEGDIVKVTYTGRNTGLNGIAPVVFDGCMFGIVWGWHKELHCLSGFSNVEFEVIGNIHDTPELLKGGADNG